MTRIVLVNIDFRDRHTGKIHKAGSTAKMSDDRITEVKSVNPEFITVIGTITEDETEESSEEVEKKRSKKTKKDEEIPQE